MPAGDGGRPRILVTGAAGFVGARLVRVLVRTGSDVYAVVRARGQSERLTAVRGQIHELIADLDEPEDRRRVVSIAQPDACFHLAWFAEPGAYVHAIRENLACVGSSLALLDEVLASGCTRLLFAGTCAEYGPQSRVLRETTDPRPETVYGAAKLATSIAALGAARRAGAALAWARLFYLYGPGEDPRRIVARLIRSALRGEPPQMEASGADVRDYLHVDDAARALVALAEAGHHGVANVCSGTPVAMDDVAEVEGE